MKKTKIICTIGPKTESKDMIEKLFKSGMDIARLNFSHGDHNEHYKRIKNIKIISKKNKKKIYIMLDTKGPELRINNLLNNKEVYLYKNKIFTLFTNSNLIGNNNCASITKLNYINKIKIGDIILIDDGSINMEILSFDKNKIICKILNNGLLGEKKSIYIPRIENNDISLISNNDKEDIIFGCNNNIDFLAISFVRNKNDILEIKNLINKNKKNNIQIISKIENKNGLNNIDEIIKFSDGIMIARGDLGINIPIEEVIFKQKLIIKKCNKLNKPVITATQMLNSMIEYPRPTRAEAGDITNAILDGTDAVMLSGESAKGNYPIESISIMNSICCKTDLFIKELNKNILYSNNNNELIFLNAVNLSDKINSKLLIVISEYSIHAKILRKFLPKAYIFCLTSNINILNELILVRGVFCIKINKINKINFNTNFYKKIKNIFMKFNFIKIGDKLIFLYGLNNKNIIDTISIHKFN